LRGKKVREVFLENVKLYLKCGVYPEERKIGVNVLVSVRVRSQNFVDYEELYKLVVSLRDKEFKYLEEFQDKLLSLIVEKWCPDSVRIRVLKLSVPFQNSFECAGVELSWER
jgi:dihydroneopterin aldolase